MAPTDPRRAAAPGRRRKGTVPAVVAAATAGVTGVTLAWAVHTSPQATASSSTTATTAPADPLARQIAADEATIGQLRQSI